ncbi:MAG: Rid family detoxifying hydrolase [Gemmatimonadales bacterium]
MPSNPSRARSTEAEYFSLPGRTGLPFSAAVRVGNLLFVSGQMGTGQSGLEIVSGGIEAETRQTLSNIKAILERRGSSLDRVVKCTVMMADMREWPAMNAVYVEHFPKHLPARSAFGCSALALGGRVEIECVATVGD